MSNDSYAITVTIKMTESQSVNVAETKTISVAIETSHIAAVEINMTVEASLEL